MKTVNLQTSGLMFEPHGILSAFGPFDEPDHKIFIIYGQSLK